MYHWLARRGWHHPEFKWYHDRRGQKLLLSPNIHLDRYIIAFWEYDKELHLGLELCVKPGMTCFDIGANICAVSLHMSKLVGRRGRVHAFEPVPPIFERLIGNVNENQLSDVIKAHQIALSNYDGIAEIRYADALTENQGMGSLVRREE